jgi:hypothetical protein
MASTRKVQMTGIGVRIGWQALNRCCLKAVSVHVHGVQMKTETETETETEKTHAPEERFVCMRVRSLAEKVGGCDNIHT